MHLQIMHESLARFSENFAGFLYGLNMNAFCVDFPEAPILESFKRARDMDEQFSECYTLIVQFGGGTDGLIGRSTNSERFHGGDDGETTFL